MLITVCERSKDSGCKSLDMDVRASESLDFMPLEMLSFSVNDEV